MTMNLSPKIYLIMLTAAMPLTAYATNYCSFSTTQDGPARFDPCNGQNASVQFSPDPIQECRTSPNPWAKCTDYILDDRKNETHWIGTGCTTPINWTTGWLWNNSTNTPIYTTVALNSAPC